MIALIAVKFASPIRSFAQLLPALLVVTLAGCVAQPLPFEPPDPGPIATENFNGEIVWAVTRLEPLPSIQSELDNMEAVNAGGAVRVPKSILTSSRALRQLSLLAQGDKALLLEYLYLKEPAPVRGKLSFGENQPLYKINYEAGTYREVTGDPASEVPSPYRQNVTDDLKLRETSEQRVILGYLCTATLFVNATGNGTDCKIWSTRALKVNKSPLLFLEQRPGPLGVMIASVRGVPLLIEVPGNFRIEATSITEKIVNNRLFQHPGTTYRLVK
jgi:hypothetical protein